MTLGVTEVKRSLIVVAVVGLSVLTACAPGPVTPTVTASPTPVETPSSPTTSPIPTVGGASGPLGVVNTNFTWVDPETGLSVAIEQVTTAPLPGTTVRSNWGLYAQVYGMRITIDTTGAASRGVTIDGWPPIGVSSDFWLLSLDQKHDADCDTLTFDITDADQKKALAALDGDQVFQYDQQSGRGDGWIACGVFSDDVEAFAAGFTIIFEGTGGHTADGTRVGSPPLELVTVVP